MCDADDAPKQVIDAAAQRWLLHKDRSLMPTCMRVLMVSAGCEDTVAISPATMPLSTYGPPGMSCAVARAIR